MSEKIPPRQPKQPGFIPDMPPTLPTADPGNTVGDPPIPPIADSID